MTNELVFTFQVLEGPCLQAPFAGVQVRFPIQDGPRLPWEPLQALLAEAVPELSPLPSGDFSFGELATELILRIRDAQGDCGYRHQLAHDADGMCRIAIEQCEVQQGIHAVQAGLELALALQEEREQGNGALRAHLPRVRAISQALWSQSPGHSTSRIVRLARRRGIPVYSPNTHLMSWLLGHGCFSRLIANTGDDRDSMSSSQLIGDKVLSNEFVTRLGFPGVRHAIAPDAPAALGLARRLGFPVVIKPSLGGRGIGITADIRTEEALVNAFQMARGSRRGPVLVERHVPGQDHRLVALNGRFAWCVRRTPAHVVGDGIHDVARLIELENLRRVEKRKAGILVTPLALDATSLATLGKQGLRPESVPGPGQQAFLTTTANVATGGTTDDMSACIHPDNRDMVEALARALHMGTLGIDFITTDITRSWREGGGAIIELNATPGLTTDHDAEVVLAAKIPEGTDARIPSVVLVGAPDALLEALHQALSANGTRAGWVDQARCQLGDRVRVIPHGPNAGLAARVQALLLDPACEALVMGLTPGELEAKGLPIDWCDRIVLWEGIQLSPALRTLAEACAGEVVTLGGDASRAIPALLEGLRHRRPHPLAQTQD